MQKLETSICTLSLTSIKYQINWKKFDENLDRDKTMHKQLNN